MAATQELRDGETTDSDPVPDDASPIPDDWIGYALDVEPPTVEYIGHAEVDENGPDHSMQLGSGEFGSEGSGADDEAQLDIDDPDILVWVEVNASSGNKYRMTMPRADAITIHTWMEEQGFTKPKGPGGEPLPPRVGPVPEEAPIGAPSEEALSPELTHPQLAHGSRMACFLHSIPGATEMIAARA